MFLLFIRLCRLQKSTWFVPVQSCQPNRSATNKDAFDSWTRRICYVFHQWLWTNIWRWPWSSNSRCTKFQHGLCKTQQHVPVPNWSEYYNIFDRKSTFYCQWNGSFWIWAVGTLCFGTELKEIISQFFSKLISKSFKMAKLINVCEASLLFFLFLWTR